MAAAAVLPARPVCPAPAPSSSPSSPQRHPGRSGKSGFPASYRRLSPVRKLEWLDSAEAKALVARGQLHFNQLAAEARRIKLEKRSVRSQAPTPVLLEDWERGQEFPPRADDPACRMRRADDVVNRDHEGRTVWPAYYILPGGQTYEKAVTKAELSKGREDDPDRDRGLFTTSSESAAAIQAAELARAQVVSMLHPKFELQPEGEQDLRRLIERYAAAVGAVKIRRILV